MPNREHESRESRHCRSPRGLLFGFDTAVISGTTQALTSVYSLTPEQLGLTVSVALVGTVIGAMTAGIPGQKYGGRETLRVRSLQAVAIGLMNLLATFLGMAVIDKLGRKTLLLIGAVGTALCLFCVSAVFYTQSNQSFLLWLLVAYIAFFAISQGAVIWVYIGEVFPTRVRAKGQSLGSASHWVMNALIAYIFPQVAKSSGGVPFMLFGAMMVLQFFVVMFAYPETKGVSLEQLQHKLAID